MQRHTHLARSLTAGTLLLVGAFAVAQTVPQKKTQDAHSGSHNPPAGIAVDHAGGNGVRRTAGNHGQPAHNGATTTTSPTTAGQRKHVAGVKYQNFRGSRNGGQNPLYEGKDKANPKESGGHAASHR